MEPLEFPRLNARSAGHSPFPSRFANEWIKSQALLTEGDPVAAVHVLGDLERRTLQPNLPLKDRYWQDAGLVAELAGDDRAGLFYGMAGSGALLRRVHPSEDVATEPVVLGFPSRRTPFFITPEGGFRGGSPFGYLAEQLRIIGDGEDPAAVETARVRALDVCSGLLGRRIRPDLVAAFRARVYLAAGQVELARADLAYAHAGFAARGEIDPGTSLLLGHLELVSGHDERAGRLCGEALERMPDSALAWRDLGVALARARSYDQAREAMERAVALDPASKEGWYNLGVLLYRTGGHDEALAALERAWSLDSADERIMSMLQVVASARRSVARTP